MVKLSKFWISLILILFFFGCVSENKTSVELIESAYSSGKLTEEQYFIQKLSSIYFFASSAVL